MRRPGRGALAAGAAALIGVSRFVTRPRVPDDYDSIGFVLSLDRFDLAHFAPHFPGYPVYVALGRLVHLVVRAPLDAATAVSAIAAAVTALALLVLGRRLGSERAGWIALLLYGASSLPWIMGGAALSDGTAAAFVALAFALLAEERWALSGVAAALMVGTRASYFPIAISWLALVLMARRRGALKAIAGAMAGTLAWAVPFVWVVGERALLTLGRTHLTGHFTDWGGTVVTRPAMGERLSAFLRDLLYDGIAPWWPALIALGALVLLALLDRRGADRPSRPSRRAVAIALVVTVPYALWALLGQNVVEQPRHLLPLVLAAIVGAALLFQRRPAMGIAAPLLALTASLPLAILHRTTEPPAAQMARYVAANYRAKETALFGARSIRFVRMLAPGVLLRERIWLSEVGVDLERVDVFPKHVLVTSEIEADPRRAPRLRPGPTFCRDPRLDRQRPCIQLFEYFLLGPMPPP